MCIYIYIYMYIYVFTEQGPDLPHDEVAAGREDRRRQVGRTGRRLHAVRQRGLRPGRGRRLLC